MKEAIGKLRCNIKRMLNLQLGYRRAYQALTWAPGSEAEVRRIRASKDLGKRALKPYKLLGTTKDRLHLLSEKGNWSHDMRRDLVTLGLLRGMPYGRVEARTEDPISARWVHTRLVELEVEAYSLEDVEKWLTGEKSGGQS